MNNYHYPKSMIQSVTVAVGNLESSEDFYTNVMQLELLSKTDSQIVLGSQNRALVTLVKSNGEHPVEEGLYHIAFLLKSETELANWLILNRQYFRFVGASNHLVSKAIYLKDPDGNGIEVYTDTDDSNWKHRGSSIQMDTLPLDTQELLEKADGANEFNFIIGHLHLQTKDVLKASNFYKYLGFNITLNMGSAIFMSFNGYHHHLAVNEWNHTRMKEHRKEVTDIQEFVIYYETKEELEVVKETLTRNRIKLEQDGDFTCLEDPLKIKIKLTYKGE